MPSPGDNLSVNKVDVTKSLWDQPIHNDNGGNRNVVDLDGGRESRPGFESEGSDAHAKRPVGSQTSLPPWVGCVADQRTDEPVDDQGTLWKSTALRPLPPHVSETIRASANSNLNQERKPREDE